MNIIIVGCGKVGTVLTHQLSKEEDSICIIDTNAEVVHKLTNTYDVMGVIGNGSSYNILSEAGIEDADLLIAVTESDELNLLCCVIAKKAGKCQTIARVRSPLYSSEQQFLQQELGLSMTINPELTAAREISQLLCFPNAIGIDIFSGGRVQLLRFKITADFPLANMLVKDISSQIRSDVLICAVERNSQIMIPSGDFTLQAGDIISLMASRQNAVDFFRKIRARTNQVKDTMIIGGGKISVYLAQMLTKLGISVKIIERNAQRCQELSEIMPDVTIINGDGSDESLLLEERITQTDSFVALTNFDEENILLSLFAKKKVKVKVVTKINRLQLTEVINNLDLDSVVYPKNLTAQKIIQHVRATKNSIGSNVCSLYRLFGDRVEALEFNIQENPRLTGIPIQQLNLKKDLLICCITRDNKVIIPGGQDMILPGDTVIIVTTLLGLGDAQDIIQD